MDSLLLLSPCFMQWHQFGLEGIHWIHCFVLDLKGEVTDVTCAPQLQLHLTEYKSNQSLESLVGSTERYSRPGR